MSGLDAELTPAQEASRTDTDPQLADQLQDTLLSSAGIDPDRWVLTALLPLTQGRPGTAAELAGATGRPEPEVQQALSRQDDLETDEDGLIVGHGLSLRPTPHAFEVDGEQLYTWCALDTLMFRHQVHFFASDAAAQPWLAEHPEAVVVGVQEGYRLAQRLVEALLDSDGPASCC